MKSYFLYATESEPVKKIPGAGKKRTGSATLGVVLGYRSIRTVLSGNIWLDLELEPK